MDKSTAAAQLAQWLYTVHPDLFLAAYHRATFGAAPGPSATHGLGDISDFLSSVGDTVGSAVSGVGTWLTSGNGLNTLAGLGTAYLTTQAQQNVLQAQIARASIGQSPLAVSYVPAQATLYGSTSGVGSVPVVPISAAGTPVTLGTPGAQVVSYVQATPSVLSQYAPSSLSATFQQLEPYWPYLLGGGVLLAFFLMRK